MNINKNIAISETGFVFNPLTGDSFSTNAVGQEVLKKLQNGSNHKDLVNHIENLFSIDKAILEKDINDFLMTLKSYQILMDDDEK